MIVRLPVKMWNRSDSRLDADDAVFTVGTAGAEFGEAEAETDDVLGLLPDGFGTVADYAEPVLDALDETDHSPEDYPDAGSSEAVLYAVVEDDPAESNEWVRFEEA